MQIWSHREQRWIRMPDGWGDPIPAGEDGDGPFFIRYFIGATHMGSIFYRDGLSYYPATQLRRFGAVGTVEIAKSIVETYALHDVQAYPTIGTA